MPQFDDAAINERLQAVREKTTERQVSSLAHHYGLQYIDLTGVSIDPEALRVVPEERARDAEMVTFLKGGETLSAAVANPENQATKELLAELEETYTLRTYLASRENVLEALERYNDLVASEAEKKGVLDVDPDAIAAYGEKFKTYLDIGAKISEIKAAGSAERTTQTIEVLFGGALALDASDIHIEPERKTVHVRYRLDGVLHEIADLDREVYDLITSRLKLLSGVKLNVKNEAQDGRFTFSVGERNLEVRSSIIPGAYGESIVMRLLDPDASSFTLEYLGLNEKLAAVMQEELSRPNGAIITTGPTGSGKTTALYAFLQEIHSPEVKIITIENPVEYKLPGIVQTQVEGDYTFESGLRAVLRQDPDVIMVGEIRDREVAETAVHAALTGHLVFSTLHTNSAAGAFARLIDLGVDPRMIGSAFNIILGQRLARKLCDTCKKARPITTEERKLMARILGRTITEDSIYDAPGCAACNETGFAGRIGIYEAIQVDTAVEEAVVMDTREVRILEAAAPQEIPTMQQDGIMKVLAGITSLDELERVIDLHNTRARGSAQETPETPSTQTSAENTAAAGEDDISEHIVT